MKKTEWKCLSIILLFLFFLLPISVKAAGYDPGPADTITKLRKLDINPNPDPNKIPLILIHGIHSTKDLDAFEDDSAYSRWGKFLTNFHLEEKYEIYIFKYLSDRESVWDIARSLRNHLDDAIYNKIINDNKFVIIAHSMGGLVARSYMEEHSHRTGFYGADPNDPNNHIDGQRGGERILKLITLATPHHGTPFANHDSRDTLAENADDRDWIYRVLWGIVDASITPLFSGLPNNWSTLISGTSFLSWHEGWFVDHNEYDEYNRKDLLWDNFDGAMNESNNDINGWLKDLLNRNTNYDNRLIAYYGFLEPNDQNYQSLISGIYLTGPTLTLFIYGLTTADLHDRLLAASIVMNYGLEDSNPDRGMGPYWKNDGLVPIQSSSFNDHIVSKQVECPNYDHLEMVEGEREGSDKQCNTGKTLFESLEDDLTQIYDIANPAFYHLSGALKDANGNSVNGYVCAYEVTGANLGNCTDNFYRNYRLALFPGTYTIYYHYNPISNLWINGGYLNETISINSEVTRDIIIPSQTYYTISGRITNNQGNGLYRVYVRLSGNSVSSGIYTDSYGNYTLYAPAGNYSVSFQAPTGSIYKDKVIQDLLVSGDIINFSQTLSEELTLINGVIRDTSGNYPPSAHIYASYLDGQNISDSTGTSNGNFVLSLMYGNYAIDPLIYFFPGNGYVGIYLPQRRILIDAGSSIQIEYPPYQFHQLSGRVTDIFNVGQSNIRLQFSAIDSPNYIYAETTTQYDGNYRIDLPLGKYQTIIDPPPALFPPFKINEIDIPAENTRNVRLSNDYLLLNQTISRLSPGLTVKNNIFDITNQGERTEYSVQISSRKQLLQLILNWPGSEMALTVYKPDGTIFGQYQSTNPPIIVDIPNPEIGIWRCEVTAIQVSYDNYPFALVVGVTPNQGPIAEANGSYYGVKGSPIPIFATGSSDSDGSIVSYEWDWDGDGFYDETTTLPHTSHTWNASYSGNINLRITDNEGATSYDSAFVSISEIIKGTISGNVQDSFGNPLGAVKINIFSTDNSLTASTLTGEDGNYIIQGLSTGAYKIEISALNLNYISEWYNNKKALQTADIVNITEGQTTSNINAQLVQGGIISGKVTNASGNGISNVSVYVYDVNFSYINNTTTDSQGIYRVQGLPSGNYKVSFSPLSNTVYTFQWYNNKTNFNTADLVSVTNGQTTANINAQLVPAGSISGRVTNATGTGIPNIQVSASLVTGEYSSSLQTDHSGNYIIRGLPAGSYQVQFYDYTGNYMSEYYNDKINSQSADLVPVAQGQTVSGVDAVLVEGGRISGRVTDALGNGISYVSVTIYDDVNFTYIKNISTDSQGNYQVQGIPPGNFKVSFFPPSGNNYLSQWFNNKASFNTGDSVSVISGQTTAGIDARLDHGGIISGRVTNASGTGIPNIQVFASLVSEIIGSSAMTDSSGNYIIQGLLTGSYRVQFFDYTAIYISEYYNDKINLNNADLVAVVTGQTTANINARLDQGGSISGRVTDAHGNGLVNVSVQVFDQMNNYISSVSSDTNGNYTVRGIPTGSFKVIFYAGNTTGNYLTEYYNNKSSLANADLVNVVAGQTTTNIDAQLDQGGSISGRVSDASGNGIQGISVSACTLISIAYTCGVSYQTDNDGNYTIPGMATGSYKVQFYAGSTSFITQWYSNKTSFNTADSVPVIGGQTTPNINAQLVLGGSISGKVTNTAGAGIPNIQVSASPVMTGYGATAQTDALGNYIVRGLAAGSYRVQFLGSNVNYISEYYNDKINFQSADLVPVAQGETVSGIDAVLVEGGRISGRVTDVSTGNGIQSVSVSVYAPNALGGYSFVSFGMTGSNGEYTIQGIPSGSYQVQFSAPTSYAIQWYNNKSTFYSASSVTVTAGQTTPNINAQLVVGGTISGRVTDASGNGIPNISVSACIPYGSGGYSCSSSGQTDSNGSYQIQKLPTDSYKVQFYGGSTFFTTQCYSNKSSLSTADSVMVTAGQTTPNIDAQLVLGGKISGRVTDGSGSGLANVIMGIYNLNNVSIYTTISDSQGNFITGPIAPGTYKVLFSPTSSYVPEWYSHKRDFNQADPVTVFAGQTTANINAQLAIPQTLTISGYVRTDTGAGIPDVVMNGLSGNPKTDANGYYSGTVSYGWSSWSGSITPSKMNYTFNPTYRVYNNFNTNQTDQDYTGTLKTDLVYYDQFNGPNIDPAKWDSWDFVREIRDVNGERKLFSKVAAYGSGAYNQLTFKEGPSITHMEADVAITEVDGNYGPNGFNYYSLTGPCLYGMFYNDGTGSPGSSFGEVTARVMILPENSLSSKWWVIKYTNAEGSRWEVLGSGTLTTGLSLEQTYRLSLDWNPATKTFTFGDGVASPQTFQPQGTPQEAQMGTKGLRTQVLITDLTQSVLSPDLWGKVSATFDNVIASGQDVSGNTVLMSDDFSSDKLDASKWATYEFVREIVDGKLVSKVRNVNTLGNYMNNLYLKNPGQINEIQAKVALQEYQNPNNLYEDDEIVGFFFNDTGDPDSGYQGEVQGQVTLLNAYSGQAPVVRWGVYRFNDFNGNSSTTLKSGTFPLTVNLGQEYNLSLKWDGSQFTFKCDDYVAYFTPTTSIFPSNKNQKRLETRVGTPTTTPPYFDGYISATFDDVQVGPGQVNAEADLAVTMTASPNPVAVGENFNYIINVTNNGPGTAAGIIVTDTLPPGLTIVSVPPNCNIASNTITCGGGSLTSGATSTSMAVVTPNVSGQITNTLTILANQTDPDIGNNTASVLTTVYSTNDTTSPFLTIASHLDGQHVTDPNITLSGTAGDIGRGENGISQVTVNGSRADNDTASWSGVANWGKSITLNAGANTITVMGYDNSANHNTTTQDLTLYYDSDLTAPASSITDPMNNAVIMGTIYVIKGSADDGGGGGVNIVEISTDGGNTWNPATGTTTWSYNWNLPVDGTYTITSRASDNAGNVETSGQGVTVTVVRRQPSAVNFAGQQLMVNGSPFMIKGVGYSPVPIGDDPEIGPPHGDYFTFNYSGIYNRDLPLLRQMGANVVRLWSWNDTANHIDFLDQAYNNGDRPIYVIPGFWINAGLDIDPNSPNNVREQLKSNFKNMVALHKNHPAILMWAIGNNLNQIYSGDLANLFSLINELAQAVHEEEGSSFHPVTTALEDTNLINTIDAYNSQMPALDVWGTNVYRGNSFGTLFSDYQGVSAKPLVIMEYGIDSYDQVLGNEYELIARPYQSEYAQSLWNDIVGHANISAGGVIRAYSDDWSLGRFSTGSGCPDLNASQQNRCGYALPFSPDGYSNEEWWGIMRIKDHGSNPDLVEPRTVYYALRSLWTGVPVKIRGSAYNYPQTTAYKATFSLDVAGPSSPSGWVKYYYSRTRMNFVSTAVSSMVISGPTATISGTGTINGVAGYTFTSTVTDGTPDRFGITIKRADGTTYYTAGPGAISGGDLKITIQ